jgi:hypothetical protein
MIIPLEVIQKAVSLKKGVEGYFYYFYWLFHAEMHLCYGRPTYVKQHYFQCCGNGSGWIGIILPDSDDWQPGPTDPDPDLYPFQPNVKIKNN